MTTLNIDNLSDLCDRQHEEILWLKYFYTRIRNALGPADADIYCAIKTEYVEDEKGVLPEEYQDDVEEDY